MIVVLIVLIVLLDILLISNYVQSVRMVRRIALQNSLLSLQLFQGEALTEEDAEPHLKVVENPPSTNEV